MTNDPKPNEPNALSLPEKILRVQDMWDEIAVSSEGVDLTPAQREEAERRLREHEHNPGIYPKWSDLKRQLESEP